MILMKDIVRDGHPALRKKTPEMTFPLSEVDIQLANDLLEYVINSQDDKMVEMYKLRPGIGLAAPQVNAEKRMFAVHIPNTEDGDVSFVAVNPKIISHSVENTYINSGEGCLSVDEVIEGYVPRHARITVTGFYPDGTPFKKRLKGLVAIAFQHELDHLNGIMFYDHINKVNPYAEIPNSVPYDRV
ncbi:peptide deformylase [Psychrobacillus sp. OK032]|uniref:peptide deformylase n=1 Tax=Psychrobacillus sp. OK032 TaxID=1884358 RepID=UPI0008C3B1F2|nr:peptide deformylase [Psychrobacillus sp. OK032]SER59707.1 peptide deformylase [Psychrobacillus sp. OK032]